MDKELIDFLSKNNCRISLGRSWLVVNKDENGYRYVVYNHRYGKKKTTTLCDTSYLSVALRTIEIEENKSE